MRKCAYMYVSARIRVCTRKLENARISENRQLKKARICAYMRENSTLRLCASVYARKCEQTSRTRAQASETTARALLIARENCSKNIFEKAVRENYLGPTVLCFALLCFASLRACNARVHTSTYIHICIYTYIHIHIHTYIHIYICTYTYI